MSWQPIDGADDPAASSRHFDPVEVSVMDYRSRALDCLQRAADASDRYERQSLLALADAFNRLAEHVRERARRTG